MPKDSVKAETTENAPEAVPIHEALRRVMAEVGVIGKGNRMKDSGGYNYRSIEDVMPVTTPLLTKHGVVPTPEVQAWEMTPHFANASGRVTEYHHLGTVRWTFTGPMGDQLVAVVMGEALDTRDKGANKAMTASLKQALTNVFQIAVKGAHDDPDHYGDDPAPDNLAPVGGVKTALVRRAEENGWPDPMERARAVWAESGLTGDRVEVGVANALLGRVGEPPLDVEACPECAAPAPTHLGSCSRAPFTDAD